MEKRIVKTALLKAMRQIRNEYKKETHCLSRDTCALCKLYLDKTDMTCNMCPMHVFWADGDASFSCMNRKCTPVECEEYGWLPEELLAVVEFYDRAINAVSSKSTKELNGPLQSFKFLREIDIQVAEKFGLHKD